MDTRILMFRASPLFLEAAANAEMPRFSMTAYTGGAMRVKNFPHPVVIDLAGMDISAQNLPIRLDHNPQQGVGHSTKIAIENGQLVAEGLISRDTSWARDVAQSGKQHSRYRMNGSFRFEKVGPGGELKHGKIDEQAYTQKADTHGIMFALTRQMIIDDDLGALTDIPRQIGMGAAEAIADAVWTLLLSNPLQNDGKTFFHNAHNNLLTGANTNLSVDSLTAAEIKFGEQTKPNGRPLGMMPTILLVPTALKVMAELLMKSTTLNQASATAVPDWNPHVGKYSVVSTSYLGNGSFDGASSKAWYLMADPNRLPALEVAFLGGMDRPTVERADADFNTLGVQFRGYIDFGVKEQDHRGVLKVKGEA